MVENLTVQKRKKNLCVDELESIIYRQTKEVSLISWPQGKMFPSVNSFFCIIEKIIYFHLTFMTSDFI